MINLERIISSNLEMLNEQETELLKSLDFVRKAKQLFQSQNGHPKKGRPSASANLVKTTARKRGKRGRIKGQGTRITKIISLLKQNGGLTSNELVDILFKQQKEDKDFGHFRQLIYTTLTNAYRKGIVKRKDGKIFLVK